MAPIYSRLEDDGSRHAVAQTPCLPSELSAGGGVAPLVALYREDFGVLGKGRRVKVPMEEGTETRKSKSVIKWVPKVTVGTSQP